MVEDKVNTKYEILTPNGWKDFVGVRKSKGHSYVKLRTQNDSLICSKDHLVLTSGGYAEASSLKNNMNVLVGSKEEKVLSIEQIEDSIDLYDALEVDTHEYITNSFISHNCEFIGSTSTLISSSKLKALTYDNPIMKNDEGLRAYQKPMPGHKYIMTVDTSRGQGKDYSAFTVIDVTQMPYRVVATFRNNNISPMLYPTVVHSLCLQYNEAYCLIEINDIGGQVADILHSEHEYSNIVTVLTMGRKGQMASWGGFGKNAAMGIRTTTVTKRVGCSTLKSIIEEDKLIISDDQIMHELFSFVARKQSYQAEDGHNDDLVMCLVLFGWLTTQGMFKEFIEGSFRDQLYEEKIKKLEEEMTPFGYLSDGMEETSFVDGDGTRWYGSKDDDDSGFFF